MTYFSQLVNELMDCFYATSHNMGWTQDINNSVLIDMDHSNKATSLLFTLAFPCLDVNLLSAGSPIGLAFAHRSAFCSKGRRICRSSSLFSAFSQRSHTMG